MLGLYASRLGSTSVMQIWVLGLQEMVLQVQDSLEMIPDSATEWPPKPTVKVRLRPAAELEVRRGHPWVYESGLKSVTGEARAGELAVVYDRQDRFLGVGWWVIESPMPIRMIWVGKPRPLDEGFWMESLQRASSLRRMLNEDPQTTGFRLIHGDGEGWPGLVLDRYGGTLVIKVYLEGWLHHLSFFAGLLQTFYQAECVVLRYSRALREMASSLGFKDGTVLYGTLPDDGITLFQERGLLLRSAVTTGQKTGFFLDQRENRALVETMSRNGRILNGFSHAGGFSLFASRGGAAEVWDVDLSAAALEEARKNRSLNPQLGGVYLQRKVDVFQWLPSVEAGRFDGVILDPPSLAPRERDVPRALLAYRALVREGLRITAPGGWFLAASCSSHVSPEMFKDLVVEEIGRSPFRALVLQETGQPLDHPARFREARYLKGIYIRRL